MQTRASSVSDLRRGLLDASRELSRDSEMSQRSGAREISRTVFLCDDETRLYSVEQQVDGRWGCGYRNFQTLYSSIAYRMPSSGGSVSPAVPPVVDLGWIQNRVETAWAMGFDPDGAASLGSRLCGTDKWIGALDLMSMLYASLRVHCFLVDLQVPAMPRSGAATVPSGSAKDRMADWVWEYFGGVGTRAQVLEQARLWEQQVPAGENALERIMRGARAQQRRAECQVESTMMPPLYLQYDGHSQTILGIEQILRKTTRGLSLERNLLIHDPSFRGAPSANANARRLSDVDRLLHPFRSRGQRMHRSHYQLLGVCVDAGGMIELDSQEQWEYRRQGAYDIRRIGSTA